MYKSDNPSLSDTWDPMPEGIVEDAEDGLSNAMPASRLGDENRQEQIAEGGAVAGPAIRVYLREMGQHALLAKAEEVELSRQIEQGRKTMLKGIGLTWRGSQSLADEIESVLSGERAMDKIVFSGPNGQAAREDDVLERLRPVHRQLTQLAGWSNGRSETARHKKGEEVSEVLSDLRFDPSRLEEIGRDILDLKGQPKERLLRKAKRAIRQGWREMEEARRKMVQGNLRLVISVARHYRNHGLDMLDLIQEGNLGLLKAVDRFDHRRGCKFSTYAVWWIRQTIRRAITTHMRPVRLPANVAELLTKLRTARENLRQDLQRQPDDEELAESLDLSIDRVEKLKQVHDEDGRPVLRNVYLSSEVYHGPATARAPDMVLGYYRDYRTSWASTLGDMNEGVLTDNIEAWAADHCIDPLEVPGVLFSNHPIDKEDPALIDLAPTILEEFGVDKPSQMTGNNIY